MIGIFFVNTCQKIKQPKRVAFCFQNHSNAMCGDVDCAIDNLLFS